MNLANTNLKYYNTLWSFSRLFPPSHWAHYSVMLPFSHKKCLEIGPGTKPKIPIKGSHFLDISPVVVNRLNRRGAIAKVLNLEKGLNVFPDAFFDLVCAFEVLEHIQNDEELLKEIHRVLKKGAVCLVSVPINMKSWNDYDRAVGHVRRYEPDDLNQLFENTGFSILQYAAIPVSWPSPPVGKLLAVLSNYLPKIIAIFQDFLDLLPNSALRKPLLLKNWSRNLPSDLYNFSTIFLLLGKK